MTPTLRVVLIVVSILTTFLLMRRIRQSRLQIEDSMFWIGFSAILILFSVFPGAADFLAGLAGTYTTANFIYLAVIFLLILKLFSMSIKMSQLETRLKELVQEMALAEHARRAEAEEGSGPAREKEAEGSGPAQEKEAEGSGPARVKEAEGSGPAAREGTEEAAGR